MCLGFGEILPFLDLRLSKTLSPCLYSLEGHCDASACPSSGHKLDLENYNADIDNNMCARLTVTSYNFCSEGDWVPFSAMSWA